MAEQRLDVHQLALILVFLFGPAPAFADGFEFRFHRLTDFHPFGDGEIFSDFVLGMFGQHDGGATPKAAVSLPVASENSRLGVSREF